MRRQLQRWFPEALFLCATTAAGLSAGGRWLTPEGDIGAWWSLTHRLALGERLYRDIYPDSYGPLSPLLLAGVERMFGSSATEFLLVNWISGIVAGLVLLLLSRNVLTTLERSALAGITVAAAVLAPGPGRLVYCYAPGAVHALVFALIALAWVGKGDDRTVRSAAIAGFFAGLAFSCKQEIGAAVAIALWLAALLSRRGRVPWLLGTAAGFGLAIVPSLVYVFTGASLHSLREDSHFWPLALAPRGRWELAYSRIAGFNAVDWPFVLRSSAWTILALLVIVVAASLFACREEHSSRWTRVVIAAAALVAWWFVEPGRLGSINAPVALSSIAAALVLLAALLGGVGNRALVGSIAAFALVMSLRTVVSADSGGHYAAVGHLATGLVWIVLLGSLLPRVLTGSTAEAPVARRAVAVALMFVGWSAAWNAAATLGSTPNREFHSPTGRVFVRDPAFFSSLARVLKPGDRVLSLPEPYALEPLFSLHSWAPRLLFLPPALDGSEERLVASLERDPPDRVVVFDRPTREYGVEPFGRGYGRVVWAWLKLHASTVASHAGGTIFTFEPISRTAARRYTPAP